MIYLFAAAIVLLGFANGTNDNFKGVVTLWGANRAKYKSALAWATVFTFFGSVTAVAWGGGLAAKFNGSRLIAPAVYSQLPFQAAVVLAAAATVLLASRLGLPISTTHALVGALVGTGIAAAGYSGVQFTPIWRGVALPLLFSPLAAMLLTLAVFPAIRKLVMTRDCVCLGEPALVPGGSIARSDTLAASPAASLGPSVRWANAPDCQTGAEVVRGSVSGALHWLSGAAISFARGMNDTPKIAALLLLRFARAPAVDYCLVAAAIALGGILGAWRVANTLGKKITPMEPPEAVGANLVSASLVLLATRWALPVSTTHVTTGGVFGIGLLQRGKADWKRAWGIVLSWLGTLPLAAALAMLLFKLLNR